MKLEVGMYVRLHGKIGKIEHICMCEQCKLRGFYEPVVDFGHEGSDYVSVYWKDDLKASRNIIDLIEVGDYVNGNKVTHRTKSLLGFEDGQDGDWYLSNENIKSIVTKKQFESMKYSLEE